MAIKINSTMVTSQGELDSAYIRIENYRVDKANGVLEVTLAMYPNEDHATTGTKTYIDDVYTGNSKVISPEIFYKKKKIEYPTHLTFPLAISTIVDEPVYEEKIVQIKYKDFDDTGKIVEKTKDAYQPVVVATKKVKKSKIDISIINDGKVFDHAYELVKSKLLDYFDESDLQDC